jgi:hypothetical protein
MNQIKAFFLAIGYWNLVGSFVLYAMLSPKFADNILRIWCQIIAFDYDVGKYGSLWLWWAATANLFYSYINIMAARWDKSVQYHILLGNIIFYGVFFLLGIGATRNKNYANGNLVNLSLCIFWLGWAVYLLFSTSF